MQRPLSNPSVMEPISILSGASLSAEINLGGRQIQGIYLPAAWTAAAITFRISHDGVAFVDLLDAAHAEYSIAAPAASGAYQVDQELFIMANYVQIRSGVSALAVNQAADRGLIVAMSDPRSST